ncbi:MAG: MerR family transcriptional regulator [Actinomycetota bacterium]
MLLRIGEFARLIGLPVRTVRYYGDIGLLPPSEVDPSTGYRRYGLERIAEARRLLALKELGLPLDEIAEVMADRLDDDGFRRLLEHHIQRLEDDLRRTTASLDRARTHLKDLTEGRKRPMPEITVTMSEAKTIAFVRDRIGDVAEIAPMFPRLFAAVDPADGVGPGGNVYHHFADDGSSIDLEAVLPVPEGYQPRGDASVRRIEPALVATITHHGAFNRLHEAYAELTTWIEANGYEITGPSYEWNLVCTPPVTQDNETYVTEIQMEVAKVGETH